MRTSTFIFSMSALAATAAFVGCKLVEIDPATGTTPLADAAAAAGERLSQNPTAVGAIEAAVAATTVIAAAYFGRKKIAAGAKVAGRVVGIVKKESEE